MLDDGMWARVLDVPAALAARRYAVEVDVLLDVHDPFLDAGGRFRLRGGPDGATCEPTDEAGAAVATGIGALGSLVLGGTRAHALAAAGLLAAPDEGVLRRLDRAFLADRSPEHGTDF
jgi:predicted acetyltransferase